MAFSRIYARLDALDSHWVRGLLKRLLKYGEILLQVWMWLNLWNVLGLFWKIFRRNGHLCSLRLIDGLIDVGDKEFIFFVPLKLAVNFILHFLFILLLLLKLFCLGVLLIQQMILDPLIRKLALTLLFFLEILLNLIVLSHCQLVPDCFVNLASLLKFKILSKNKVL